MTGIIDQTGQDRIVLTPDKLCLGMYVELPDSWLEHPFLLNRFLIQTDKQLEKLNTSALTRIVVDLDKSKLPAGWMLHTLEPDGCSDTAPIDPRESGDLPRWNPLTLVPERLLDALHDAKLCPQKRSEVVYTHSREMISRLLDSPTAKNLRASKKVIGSIGDLVLSDDAVASNMLQITRHDFHTYTHSVNVGVMGLMLAKALLGKSDAHDMHALAAGFFLHDLGKVKLRQDLINKPGQLTEEERRHVNTHPYKGYKLLKDAGEMNEEARVIILQHHERVDGSGYPKQLGARQIHIYAKICAIADVYDALTAERSYKKGLRPFDALRLMKTKMEGQFDPKLFAAFVRLLS